MSWQQHLDRFLSPEQRFCSRAILDVDPPSVELDLVKDRARQLELLLRLLPGVERIHQFDKIHPLVFESTNRSVQAIDS